MKPGTFTALAMALAAAATLLSSSPSKEILTSIKVDDDVELIPVDGGAAGPESLAFDLHGQGPYAGVSDGRVIRWIPAERRWVEHSSSTPELLDSCRGSQDTKREHECGRPLGLRFNNKTGDLYVADAYHGLRVVSAGDKVSRPIEPRSADDPFSFANGVEIDHETGAVYFTKTSTRFHRREFLNIVISGDTTGRLLKYDPKSGQVQVLADGLAFPNGLAMSEDGSYLLLAETSTGKIMRYWLKTSTLEEFAQLPGFPDNIKASPRGGYWVALHAKRGKIAELSTTYPWLRRLVMKLPARRVQGVMALLGRFGRQVIALRLSEEGKVVEEVTVHGAARKAFASISEVEERDGCLWIGSVLSPFLGFYRL